MAERKTKAQILPGGPFLDAVEVPVSEELEKWSEYKLEDGTTLRLKQVVLEIVRFIDQYDPEGNPMYSVRAQPVISVVNIPDRLKKKSN
jgi:hypothetical protein